VTGTALPVTPSDQRRLATLAADPAVHRAFHWLHLHELQLRRWQLEFLAIPAPPFQEDARAVWFCRQFRTLGLRNPHIDAEGNTVALAGPEPTPEQPALLLSAHLDTVFPPGTPCDPKEDGARILCPGACDNGAGLAALLAIAAALQHAGLQPACPVVFAANVGEEGPGDLRGIRHLLTEPPFGITPGAVIALEGAGNALVVDRALGSRRLRVTVSGPGGHSWADTRRPNPILALSAALIAISSLPLPTTPRTILNIGTFRGGTSVNSVPETATAELDLRSTSIRELDRLEIAVLSTLSAEIAAETRDRPESDRLRLSVERIGDRPVGALSHDSPLYQSLRAVDRHLNLTTEPRLGSTDANIPLAQGIPAFAIGAGGTGAGLHSTAEWYDPTGRELALRRILLLLLDTCGWLASAPSSR
jgi:tripeptide aminopeptidase